ncbi:hypothetical protein QFC24_004613 [Naganishia onofrii]|uniref:Uncharacterized protein n=2 Tax=Naganishia onofrii TaxID=1851511 RepID=A0ACC2XEY4_9TREE|nr:hypothetical protein QFC24_004612 [Naganishia onofrii]KAJ9121277.1 hypothetical protein QFC24_004613 [Naganishia onofrii]
MNAVWELLNLHPKTGFMHSFAGSKKAPAKDSTAGDLLCKACVLLESGDIPSIVFQGAKFEDSHADILEKLCYSAEERVYGIFLLLIVDYLAACDKPDRHCLLNFLDYVQSLVQKRHENQGKISSSTPKWMGLKEYEKARNSGLFLPNVFEGTSLDISKAKTAACTGSYRDTGASTVRSDAGNEEMIPQTTGTLYSHALTLLYNGDPDAQSKVGTAATSEQGASAARDSSVSEMKPKSDCNRS